MCDAVEQRRRHLGVAKYGDPFGKRQVCCDEERCFSDTSGLMHGRYADCCRKVGFACSGSPDQNDIMRCLHECGCRQLLEL